MARALHAGWVRFYRARQSATTTALMATTASLTAATASPPCSAWPILLKDLQSVFRLIS